MVRGTRVLAGAFALVGVLGALTAAPAAAQRGSFTPWAGAYVPTRNSFSTVGTDISRDNSFIMGARFTFWGKSPIGFELTGGFAPARVRVSGTTINAERNTEVFLAGAKLMLGLSPAESRIGVFLSGGPSLIRVGNNVARESESSTDWGGVVGLGFRFPISNAIGLRIEGEDFFYGGNFDGSSKFQNDLVLSAGLAIGW
ncbi:MAG TPA: outer membrane beta-barrel protein [Gemmatimonadales bacterium]|nr:outer membrane beta-barrel protein [Gemmatimonadales bacterium]